jgi:uncharacterized protein YbbC (DUF1343 family)
MQQLQSGIDVFLEKAGAFNNKKIALVTNNAATTSTGKLGRVALLEAGLNIIKLFSPEHGLNRNAPDGEAQFNCIDEITGLPVISLYGEKMSPSEEDLYDIDLVVFDIPDVGCRFYTYLWTMTRVMEACAENNKPLLVLDRPNPAGIDIAMAEGPMLDEKNCSSFIGRWSIPVKHCCTMGELALYFTSAKINQLHIEVVKVAHYHRRQSLRHVFTFMPTSPAIQNIETALLYPGMGLLEGINVNEGRGTDMPFSVFGAPWIDGAALMKSGKLTGIPGIITRPVNYTPQNGVYACMECSGLQISVADEILLQPVSMGIALLKMLFELYPQQIAERLYPTAANPGGAGHLDKLLGLANAFERFKHRQEIDTVVHPHWFKMIRNYLIY